MTPTLQSVKAADYRSIVGITPKEGLAGPNQQSLFDMTMTKTFRDMFLQHMSQLSSHTSNVGVTKVRQGFSMPPYGKEGGRTSRSYTPHTYGPSNSSAVANICSVCNGINLISKLTNLSLVHIHIQHYKNH